MQTITAISRIRMELFVVWTLLFVIAISSAMVDLSAHHRIVDLERDLKIRVDCAN